MEIKQLRIFCKVAQMHGFSAAAEELALTQPSISFQIASLEEELGTRLLDRSGRITSLTRSGEVLYNYAQQILKLNHEAEQAVHRLKGLLWGEIQLGASTIPGEYILPQLLQKFSLSHPAINLRMTISDTNDINHKILENEVEIGVVGASAKNEKLIFTRFTSDKLVLITPPDAKWFKSNIVTFDEMKRAPFINREYGSGTRTAMENVFENAGYDFKELGISMTLGSTEAVKRAVVSGAGISIVSNRSIENEIRLELLEARDIDNLDLTRNFFIVHRKNRVPSPAVEAMIQLLLD